MCSLILAWHVLSALPQGDLSGTVSAVFTHGRPGRVALAPGGLLLAPPLRGSGIGTWLVQQACAWAVTLAAATRVEASGFAPAEPTSSVEQMRLSKAVAGKGGLDYKVAWLRLQRRWKRQPDSRKPGSGPAGLLAEVPATNFELANYERLTRCTGPAGVCCFRARCPYFCPISWRTG